MWGSGADTETLFGDCLAALADDPGVDAVALAVDLVEEYDGDESFLSALEALLGRTDKPVAVLANLASAVDQAGAARLRATGIPVLEGTASGLRALGHLLAPPPRAAAAGGPSTRSARARWTRGGSTSRGADLLADYGVAAAAGDGGDESRTRRSPRPRRRLPGRAQDGGRRGAPQDGGGRRTPGAGAAEAVASAYDDLAGRLGPEVLVQHQVSGVEVALGIVADPLLGPLVVVAAGGTLVELVADRAVALPPVSREAALAMIGRLRLSALLAGFRGAPAGRRAALADAVVALGRLAVELGDLLAGVDVNPLVVGRPTARVAVDALVVPR